MKKTIAAVISLALCTSVMLASCSVPESSSANAASISNIGTTTTASVTEKEAATTIASADSTSEASSAFEEETTTTTTTTAVTDVTTIISSAELSADTVTATDLLAMTVDEALALGNNSYEMAYPKGVQDGTDDMYKCNSFSAYTFKSSGGNSGIIDNLNLYYGGRIDDMVGTGLTFSQLEAYIPDLAISYSYDDLMFASLVNYAGHTWEIGYELTDDQKTEIKSRLDKAINAGEYGQNTASVSISDLDPISSVIVYKTSLN